MPRAAIVLLTMRALVIAALAGLSLAFDPATAADPPPKWEVIGRCATLETASPGLGLFEVRIKRSRTSSDVIDIRGCGKNRAFRKVLRWGVAGADDTRVQVFAVPFFKKGRFDILLASGLDETTNYYLYAAAQGYKEILNWTSYNGPFFGDIDDDGRWEVQLIDLVSIECANGSSWAKELNATRGVMLTAGDICRLDDDRGP